MTMRRRWQVLYRLRMEDLLLTLCEGGSRCSVWSCYGWRTCHDYVKEMAGALQVVHGGLTVSLDEGGSRCPMWSCYGWRTCPDYAKMAGSLCGLWRTSFGPSVKFDRVCMTGGVTVG